MLAPQAGSSKGKGQLRGSRSGPSERPQPMAGPWESQQRPAQSGQVSQVRFGESLAMSGSLTQSHLTEY